MTRKTITIDIDNSAHSSLIGKNGELVKRIMTATNTLIHFPDINKISSIKSNTVTLKANYSEGLFEAMNYLRDLQPLELSFRISDNDLLNNPFDLVEYLDQITHKLDFVTIDLTKRPNLYVMKFLTKNFGNVYSICRHMNQIYPNMKFCLNVNVSKEFRFPDKTLFPRSIVNVFENVGTNTISVLGSIQDILKAYVDIRDNLVIESTFSLGSISYQFAQKTLEDYKFPRIELNLLQGRQNKVFIRLRTVEKYRIWLLFFTELFSFFFERYNKHL